jgi:hypothetical protein
MFAPNGTLYGFDADYGSSGVWGSINTATGAFTQIGNLGTYFPSFDDHTEFYGFSLAFGSSGTLYATGCVNGNTGETDFGTLNLTTGAFTKIAASPVSIAGSLAAPIPEPGTFALLAAGSVGVFGYGLWRRRVGRPRFVLTRSPRKPFDCGSGEVVRPLKPKPKGTENGLVKTAGDRVW